MDWELLQTFVGQGNTQQFLKQVAESLQTGNKQFGIVQKGLRVHCFQQVEIESSRQKAYIAMSVCHSRHSSLCL